MPHSASKNLIDLQRALQARLGEDSRFDPYTRILYSTDASNYQIEPIGVFFPRQEEDVERAVRVSREPEVPILPRRVLVFRASNLLKSHINKPKSGGEPQR